MLIKFKQFLQNQSKLIFKRGAETPSSSTKTQDKPTEHQKNIEEALRPKSTIKIGSTTVHSINHDINLPRMSRYRTEFLSKHSNLELQILSRFKLSEANQYCSTEELQDLSNLFINGICPLESGYGTYKLGKISKSLLKRRKQSGPFQLRQSFMKDFKNITLTEKQQKERRYNLYHRIKNTTSPEYHSKYFKIINNDPNFKLTEENRTANLRKMSCLSPTSDSDIATLIALQIQRIIDSAKSYLSQEPFTGNSKTAQLLRKTIFLIGYKAGPRVAKNSCIKLTALYKEGIDKLGKNGISPKTQSRGKLFKDHISVNTESRPKLTGDNPVTSTLKILQKTGIIGRNTIQYTLQALQYQAFYNLRPKRQQELIAASSSRSKLESLKEKTDKLKIKESIDGSLKEVLQNTLPLQKPRRMKLKISSELNKCLKRKKTVGKIQTVKTKDFKRAYRDRDIVIININKITPTQYKQILKKPKHWPMHIAERYAKALNGLQGKINQNRHIVVPRVHIKRSLRKHISE